MLRYRWLTLILIPLLALPVALARQSGMGNPSPFAPWLTDPEGRPCPQPCVLGIIPGKTEFEAALRMIPAHPLAQTLGFVRDIRGSETLIRFHSAEIEIQVVKQTRGSRVDLILLFTSRAAAFNPVRLGTLMAMYGTPDRVSVGDSELSDLYYDEQRLHIMSLRSGPTDASPISPDDVIWALQLRAPATYQVLLVNLGPSLKAWRGLARAGRYRDVRDPIFVP